MGPSEKFEKSEEQYLDIDDGRARTGAGQLAAAQLFSKLSNAIYLFASIGRILAAAGC